MSISFPICALIVCISIIYLLIGMLIYPTFMDFSIRNPLFKPLIFLLWPLGLIIEIVHWFYGIVIDWIIEVKIYYERRK